MEKNRAYRLNMCMARMDDSRSIGMGMRNYGLPAVVLDPFGGAGTTGMVADRLGRDAVLIELNPEYAHMAEMRISEDAGPMFARVEVVELGS